MIIQRIKMKKDDWLDLSLKLLSQNGVKALKIDFLCEEIKLTKGSFYHHFKNHNSFINELLQYWYKTYTLDIINEIKKYEDNVITQIEIINELMYSKDLNVEIHFRALALDNSFVYKYLEKVDEIRIQVIIDIQKKLSPNSSIEEVDLLATCVYAQFIGSLFIFPKIEVTKQKKMDEYFLDLFLKSNY